MTHSERIYCQQNTETGLTGWFFNAREDIYGPFSTEENAIKGLEEFIKFNIEFSDDGGRSLKESSEV